MTWIVMSMVLLGAAVGQVLVPGPAVLGQARPPLLLCAVLYYALVREPGVMMVAAFAAGVLLDGLSAVPLGSSALLFCLVGWAASRLRGLVLTDSLVTWLVLGGLAGTIATALMAAILIGTGQTAWPAGRVLVKVAGSGLLGAACAPVVYAVAGGLDRMVGNTRSGRAAGGFLG